MNNEKILRICADYDAISEISELSIRREKIDKWFHKNKYLDSIHDFDLLVRIKTAAFLLGKESYAINLGKKIIFGLNNGFSARKKRLNFKISHEKPRNISTHYSLWGNKADYVFALIDSCLIQKVTYPNSAINIYIDETVNSQILDIFKIFNALIILKERSIGLSGTFWRFDGLFQGGNCLNVFRDADSVITKREINIWNYCLNHFDEKYCSYFIRDHWMHTHLILAGMFGIHVQFEKDDIEEAIKRYPNKHLRLTDQLFLAEYIWGGLKDRSIQFDRYYSNAIPKVRYEDIGQIGGELTTEDLHIGAKKVFFDKSTLDKLILKWSKFGLLINENQKLYLAEILESALSEKIV